MEKPKPKELQKEVADKYEVLKGHGVGEYHYQGDRILTENLTLDAADQLVENGFPYLVAKAAAGEKVKVVKP